MFVVYGIEFAALEHLSHIGHFDDRHTISSEQHRDATHKTVQVRNVRKHVVGVDHIGAIALFREFLSQRLSEKLADSRNPSLLPGYRGDVVRRLNAQNRNSNRLIVLEQVTIVARDLHDELRSVQMTCIHKAVNELPRMRQHRIRKGGKIWVVKKQLFWRHSLG